jgi:hypothetical protein
MFKQEINTQGIVKLLSFSGEPSSEGIGRVCRDGESISIKALLVAAQAFKHSVIPETSLQKSIQPLVDVFAAEDIYYRHGFTITEPRSERHFSFFPQAKENPPFCPEYGVTVIQSSDLEDYEHTLVSNWMSTEKTDAKNLNLNKRTRRYWRNKLDDKLSEEHIFLLTRFDEMSKATVEHPTTLLTDLVNIFHVGLGFDNIYIFDPACRSCSDGHPLETDEYIRSGNLFVKEAALSKSKKQERRIIAPSTRRLSNAIIHDSASRMQRLNQFLSDVEESTPELYKRKLQKYLLDNDFLPITYPELNKIIANSIDYGFFMNKEQAKNFLDFDVTIREREIDMVVGQAFHQQRSILRKRYEDTFKRSFRDSLTKGVLTYLEPLSIEEQQYIIQLCVPKIFSDINESRLYLGSRLHKMTGRGKKTKRRRKRKAKNIL